MKSLLIGLAFSLPLFLSGQTWFEKGEKTEDNLLKVDYFTHALEEEKKDNWTYYRRGFAFYQLENYERALDDFILAEAAPGNLDPSFIHCMKAWCYYVLDRYPEGMVSAQKATALKPTSADGFNVLGWLHIATNSPEKAIEDWTQFATLKPKSSIPYSNLSYAYLLSKNYPKVLESCDNFLAIEPENPRIKERRALALIRLGRQEEALASLPKKIEFQKDDPRSLSELGNMFFNTGDYHSAIEFHTEGINLYNKKIAIDTKFIKLYKEDVYNIYMSRGEAWYKLKEYQRANQDYWKASTIWPENYLAWYQIGELQTFQENYAEGAANYEKAFALKPDLQNGWVNLGFCYDRIKQPKKALDAYTRGLGQDPENGLLWNNRGYGYLKMKDYPRAFSDLNQAIAVAPDLVMSHVSLGEYYYYTGDYAAAVVKFNEALQMPDGGASAYFTGYFTRGLSFEAQQEFLKAEADFKMATEWNPRDARAWEHLGMVEYEQKKSCAAYQHLKKALDMDSRNREKVCTQAGLYLAKITRNPCP